VRGHDYNAGPAVSALVLGLVIAAPPAFAEKTKAAVQAVTAGEPVLKYEQFRRKVEIRVAAKREEQIAGLLKLLELGPEEAEVPDIKFRLAELYFEKSQFFFFRGQEADDRLARASAPEKPAIEDEKRKHQNESRTWTERATDIYKEIRTNYPKYPRMPEVLFALGQSYWTSGRFEEAVDVYRDLIQTYKDSPLVADAWLAFGEYYFNEGALHRALKSYEYAAKDKRSRVYGFALYKQAWCYYNLQEWEKAIERFRATIFYSQMSDELSGENRISLAREAQKDFVKAYSFVGESTKAKFVLADISNSEDCSEPECLKLLEQLGSVWADQGKFDDAAYLFKQLIQLRPKNTRNPYYQGKIVDLVSRSGEKPRVIAECRALVDAYNRVLDLVNRGEGGEEAKTDLEEARLLAESTVRRLAQLWNREAKKTRQPKTYEHALVLYEDYMKLFADAKYAYEMRFQLADLFYKLERFDEAATAYQKTVEADPKGEFLVDAANDNILAVEEHLKDLRLPKPAQGKGPLEIHEQRMRLVGACDRYVKFVPADKVKDLPKIKYKAARIFYEHNQFPEALRRFDEIVQSHPKVDEADIAANLVIDIHNLTEDWKKLYEASASYLRLAPLVEGRDKLKADLTKFGQYAKFKLIQILESDVKQKRSGLRSVAEAYEEFQQEFPTSENADKALFNASVVWDTLAEKDRADALRARLLKEYKDSPLRADVAFYAARTLEGKAEYKEAAELFAGFAEKYPDDARARDAMYNAAVFFAGVGAVTKATKLREDYLKSYGTQKGGEKEAASIYFSIAADLEAAGRGKQAAQRYEEFTKSFTGDERVFEALWRQARLLEADGKQSAAEKVEDLLFGTFVDRKKKGQELPPAAADYASRVAFARVDADFTKYERLRIAPVNLRNPTRFQKTLEEKALAREQMIKGYTRVVTEYQQAYSSIASLNRIAAAWDVYVKELLEIPCPKELNEDQCGLFKQGLEEKIGPARESAYQAYLSCVSKSNALNVFTPHSTGCVRALEQLAPDRYPPLEEKRMNYQAPRNEISLEPNPLILGPPDPAAHAEVKR